MATDFEGDRATALAENAKAVAYLQGQGVAKNPARAAIHFQKAAELGYEKAQFNLGVMYAKGIGVPKNLETARFWFSKAAQAGEAKALDALKAFGLSANSQSAEREIPQPTPATPLEAGTRETISVVPRLTAVGWIGVGVGLLIMLVGFVAKPDEPGGMAVLLGLVWALVCNKLVRRVPKVIAERAGTEVLPVPKFDPVTLFLVSIVAVYFFLWSGMKPRVVDESARPSAPTTTQLGSPVTRAIPDSSTDTTFIPKLDGTVDARPDDLENLCKDWLFYRKQILVKNNKGDAAGADEARQRFKQVNQWLAAYRDEDVNRMFAKLEREGR